MNTLEKILNLSDIYDLHMIQKINITIKERPMGIFRAVDQMSHERPRRSLFGVVREVRCSMLVLRGNAYAWS